jgi:hypothetical protein
MWIFTPDGRFMQTLHRRSASRPEPRRDEEARIAMKPATYVNSQKEILRFNVSNALLPEHGYIA